MYAVQPEDGKPCRFTTGPRHRQCGNPSRATLLRGRGKRASRWHYCADHLYGRWIEGETVMCWRMIADEPKERGA